jgi:hypothetical protein
VRTAHCEGKNAPENTCRTDYDDTPGRYYEQLLNKLTGAFFVQSATTLRENCCRILLLFRLTPTGPSKKNWAPHGARLYILAFVNDVNCAFQSLFLVLFFTTFLLPPPPFLPSHSTMKMTFYSKPVTLLHFPDLLADTPWKLNPNPLLAQVEQECQEWWSQYDVFPAGKKAELFLKQGFGLFAALMHPRASHICLTTTAHYLYFLFAFDDIAEKVSADEVIDMARAVFALLDPTAYPGPTPVVKGPVKELVRCMDDVWKDLLRTSTPVFQRRFLADFKDYVDAVIAEVSDKNEQYTPDVESYVAARRKTGACRTTFDFIEYCDYLDIPDSIYASPLMEQLSDAGNDIITWSNDIYSYNREYWQGIHNYNMVSVIVNQNKATAQEAINATAELYRARVQNFIEIKEQLLESVAESFDDPKVLDHMTQYVEGLENSLIGCVEFNFASNRYFGEFSEVVRRELVIPFAPGPARPLPGKAN